MCLKVAYDTLAECSDFCPATCTFDTKHRCIDLTGVKTDTKWSNFKISY